MLAVSLDASSVVAFAGVMVCAEATDNSIEMHTGQSFQRRNAREAIVRYMHSQPGL